MSLHPLLIAGWCGLTTTALNLLPVGALDGGRITQAALGRRALSITGLLSYAGLALGVLAGPLSLAFGLLVLITQRVPARAPRDDVTPVGTPRVALAAGLLLLTLLILLPGGDISNSTATGIGPLGL